MIMEEQKNKKDKFKKFVRMKEGVELYSMSRTTLTKRAREANAIYKVGSIVLLNTEIMDNYLELFREEYERE